MHKVRLVFLTFFREVTGASDCKRLEGWQTNEQFRGVGETLGGEKAAGAGSARGGSKASNGEQRDRLQA